MAAKLKSPRRCLSHHLQGAGAFCRPHYRLHSLLLTKLCVCRPRDWILDQFCVRKSCMKQIAHHCNPLVCRRLTWESLTWYCNWIAEYGNILAVRAWAVLAPTRMRTQADVRFRSATLNVSQPNLTGSSTVRVNQTGGISTDVTANRITLVRDIIRHHLLQTSFKSVHILRLYKVCIFLQRT